MNNSINNSPSLYHDEEYETQFHKKVSQLLKDAKFRIKKRLYKKAYQSLDGFYQENKFEANLLLKEKMKITQKIIQCLLKILSSQITKIEKVLNINEKKKKVTQVLERLNIALNDYEVFISQYMRQEDDESNEIDSFKQSLVNLMNKIPEEEIIPTNERFIPSENEQISLLNRYFIQQLKTYLLISQWFKKINKTDSYFFYANQSQILAIQLTNEIQLYKIEDRKIGVIAAQCQLNFVNCLHESGNTQEALKYLKDVEINLISNIEFYIENNDFLNSNKFSKSGKKFIQMKKELKKNQKIFTNSTKTLISLLIIQSVLNYEQFKINRTLDLLQIALWILDNLGQYISIDGQKYIKNLINLDIKNLQCKLKDNQDIEQIFWTEYEKDSKVQELFKIHKQKVLEKNEVDNKLCNEFQQKVSQKYKLNAFSKYMVVQNRKSVQDVDKTFFLTISNLSREKNKSELGNIDQILDQTGTKIPLIQPDRCQTPSQYRQTYGLIGSISVRTREPSQITYVDISGDNLDAKEKPKILSKSQIKRTESHKDFNIKSSKKTLKFDEERNTKLLTTAKYFLPMKLESKVDFNLVLKNLRRGNNHNITSEQIDNSNLKEIDNEIQQLKLKQRQQIQYQTDRIINFETELGSKKKASSDLDLDNVMGDIIIKKLIKENQSKNMRLQLNLPNIQIIFRVEEEMDHCKKDEDFDRKEFGFCKSMLHFKNSVKMIEKPLVVQNKITMDTILRDFAKNYESVVQQNIQLNSPQKAKLRIKQKFQSQNF